MSSSGDKIVWKAVFETGVEKIDEQHQVLVSIINRANRLLSQDYALNDLQSIMKDLIHYTQFHFETEEELMQTYGYDREYPQDYETHIDQHLGFSTKILETRNKLQVGEEIDLEAVINYLCDWLVVHITNTDQKLAGFLDTVVDKREVSDS